MIEARRLVAGLVSVVLVVSGLLMPSSGAAAASPVTDPGAASVEPVAAAEEAAVSTKDDAKGSAREEQPSADPEQSEEVTSSGGRATPPPDDGGAEPSDDGDAAKADDDATSSGGDKTGSPADDEPESSGEEEVSDPSSEVVVGPAEPAESGVPVPADVVSPAAVPVSPSPVPIRPLAAGTLATIVPTVYADGTIGDGPTPAIPPAAGPVKVKSVVDGVLTDVILDDSDYNGIVATQDLVAYKILVTPSESAVVGDTMSLVGTLPSGVKWISTSYSSSSCNVSGAGYNMTGTFTCKWAYNGESDKEFTWYAYVESPPLAGSTPGAPVTFAPTFSDGNGGLSVPGPSLEVVAIPAARISASVSDTVTPNVTFEGQVGAQVRMTMYVEVYSVASLRGYEAPGTPFSYSVVVPDNVRLVGVSDSFPAGQKTQASQSAIGDDIAVTVNYSIPRVQNTKYYSGGSNGRYLTYNMDVFVPYDTLVVGVPTQLDALFVGFDPNGMSGRSNFGAGVAPGQEPGAACLPNGGLNVNCHRISLTRPDPDLVVLAGGSLHVRAPGDATRLYSYVVQRSPVLAGQPFALSAYWANGTNATANMTGSGVCMTWDSSLEVMQGSVRVSSGATGLYAVGGAAWATDRYVAEYASVAGLDPASFVCGQAGSAPTGEVTWVTDPASLPGGMASVNAVRVKVDDALPPGGSTYVSVQVPVIRTTAPLALGTQIRFYSRFSANEPFGTGSSPSSGASFQVSDYVIASDVFVRAKTAVNRTTASALDLVTFTVTPTVIGPLTDETKVATDTKIVLSFSSACVDVAGTLAALAEQGLTASLTAAGAGFNGCLTGSTSGPQITVSFGDVGVPGSSTPLPIYPDVPGNENYLGSPITVPVAFYSKTPSNTTVKMRALISSPNDTTDEGFAITNSSCSTSTDRRSTCSPSVLLNTATALTVSKQAVVNGAAGSVATGEGFSYRVAMLNTEVNDLGEGSLVDVLPFAGDPRIVAPAVDGLAPDRSLTVTGVEAAMVDGANQPVAVDAYCSTHDPAAILASLAGDRSGGGIPGEFGWQACGQVVPPGTTAVRFAPSSVVSFGMLTGLIHVTAPKSSAGGSLVNNVSYEVQPGASGSVRTGAAGAVSTVLAAGFEPAELTGAVRRDLNFNSILDAPGVGSDQWWPEGATVRLLAADGSPVLDLLGVPFTATVGADGSFTFPAVPVGEHRLALAVADAPEEVWQLVAPTDEVILSAEGASVDLLYQEIVPDPVLVSDPALGTVRVPVGGVVTVDVTANDTLSTPSASALSPAVLVLNGSGTTSRGGNYVLSATKGEVYPDQPRVTYTAPEVWPSEETGLSYTDSFTYSWTNVLGVTETATVTITVQKPPAAEDQTVTVPVTTGEATYGLPAFEVETVGESWTVEVKDSTLPSGMSVTVNDSDKSFTVVTTGAASGSHEVVVVVTDDLGQQTEVPLTVIVQALPTAEGGAATIGVAGGNGTVVSAELDGSPKQDPEVQLASIDLAETTLGEVTTADGDTGSVSATLDLTTGRVLFAASVPGTYTVPVRYFDNLGQWVDVQFTVTVRDLVVIGETASTVKVGERYSHYPEVNHADDVVSMVVGTPPGQGTVYVDQDTGEVRYDATGAEPGAYSYEIVWTDDLGQTASLIHKVTVWDEVSPTPPAPTPPAPVRSAPLPPTPVPPAWTSTTPPATQTPTPSPVVGTGGTATGDRPDVGVAGLALTGIAVLFAAAWILGRRRGGGIRR